MSNSELPLSTKRGKPTKHGLACGYVRQVKTTTLSKQLFQEHGAYHVRSTVNNSPQLHSVFVGGNCHLFTIWECFEIEQYQQALKFYNSIK